MIIDGGTTGHYLTCNTPVTNIQSNDTPISVQMPNNDIIHSTHTATLDLPMLPQAARQAHILPDSKEHALLSVGVLCDNGCNVTFDKNAVNVIHKNKIALTGSRNINGLWDVDLPKPTGQANLAVPSTTIADTMQYLHACCFSPVTSTWVKAINNGNFTTWPGLTSQNVKKHLPKSTATTLGHLDQNRQGTNSTKPSTPNNDEEMNPKQETPNQRTNHIYASIQCITPTGLTHSDQTGRFPTTSSDGNKHIMVVYDYDSNAILAEPLFNRTAPETLRAYKAIHQLLLKRGLQPKLQCLDNEASTILKNYLDKNDIDFQLVPPGMHRRNAAERAMRTFKNHLIAGLCSTDPNFPLFLWDELIEQALITLNLLRNSRINPKLSSYAQIHGAFDFNKTPLAPPGTRIVSHVKPDKRQSWAPHGETGWYVGPAMQHCCCYRVYTNKTKSFRISDTVEFFLAKSPLPHSSSADAAQHAARDLVAALQHPHPAAPFHPLGDEQLTALRQLADILNNARPRVAGTQHKKHTDPLPPTAAAAKATQAPSQAIPDTPLHQMVDSIHTDHHENLFMNAVLDPETGTMMECRNLITNPKTKQTWLTSSANEFGRLAQGVGNRTEGTDTIFFIHHHETPKDRLKDVTYARFACTLRPQKKEVERTRITVGGNLINHPGNTSAPTADITTFKCLINHVISTPNTKCCTVDLKNFYLNTPMDRHEHARMPMHLIPQEIIDEHNLKEKAHNGCIHIRIEKGMCGLPQAGRLANDLLQKRLSKHGCHQTRHTPGLWAHATKPTKFTLVVDDFATACASKADVNHLIQLLQRDCEDVSVDWNASLHCGITLKWDCDERTCELSMPGCVEAALHKFGHNKPNRAQNSPHRHNQPKFGRHAQLTDPPDKTSTLNKTDGTRIQQIVGTFLCHARAVDETMLVALSAIASNQAKATELTAKDTKQFLDCCATHPDAKIKHHSSDMKLKVHSDAGCLNESNARSRAGGHFYLGNNKDPDVNNASVLTRGNTKTHRRRSIRSRNWRPFRQLQRSRCH